MQQIIIYWQSIIPQHVSGVFTPIIRRADCVSLLMVFCPDCGCCGSGGSGSEMCTLWKVKQHPLHSAHISLPDCPEPQQPQPRQKTIGSDTQSALLMMGVNTPETCSGIINNNNNIY